MASVYMLNSSVSYACQMVRDVLESIEQLDGALKQQQPVDTCKPIVQRLSERVDAVAVVVDRSISESK